MKIKVNVLFLTLTCLLMMRNFNKRSSLHAYQKSVHLLIPIFQVIITAEIVTKHAVAKINMSPLERRNLFNETFWKRYELIDKYLINMCDELTAVKLLRSYVYATTANMKNMVLRLKNCNSPPHVYMSFKLKNPDYYERLRFNLHVEHWLNQEQAIQRINNMYSKEEISLINIPLGELFDDYFANKLLDTVTFDDYFALKVLLSNPEFIDDKESFIHCQIMKAVYRLAVRQFDARPQRKRVLHQEYIFCLMKDWKINKMYAGFLNKLTFCYEDNTKWDSIDENVSKFDISDTKTYLKIETLQLYLIVNLNNVFENLKYYLILPPTYFDLDKSANIIIGEERINLLYLKSAGHRHSSWLAEKTNLAFKLEERCKRST